MKKYNVETLELGSDGKFTFYRDIKMKFNPDLKIYNNHKNINKEFVLGEMLVIEKQNKLYMIPIDLDGIKLIDEYLLSNYATYREIAPPTTIVANDNSNILESFRTFTDDALHIVQLSRNLVYSNEFGAVVDFVNKLQFRKSKSKGGVYARK